MYSSRTATALYELIFNLYENELPTDFQQHNMSIRTNIFNEREMEVQYGLLSNCYFKEFDLIQKSNID